MTVLGCEAIWDNGPTQLLRDIFSITKTQGVETLEPAIKQSNLKWMRPKGLERWHAYSLFDDAERNLLTEKIKNSALAKEKLPTKKHYNVVAIFGTITLRVNARIKFLVHLYKMGITADKVYLLGSTRNLKNGDESDQEMAKVLVGKNVIPTEMAMMNDLWQHTTMLSSLKAIPVISIQSREQPDGARANTEDTLIEMLKNMNKVEDKTFLFISNNPYICYQDAVAKRVLEKYNALSVETVGEGITDASMENVLDTVARCLTNMQRP